MKNHNFFALILLLVTTHSYGVGSTVLKSISISGGQSSQINQSNIASCESKVTTEAPAYLKINSENRLTLKDKSYNYPSVNIFDLVNHYVNGDIPGGKKELKDAAAAGFKSIRFFAAGIYNETRVQYDSLLLWQSDPEKFFTAINQIVADAKCLDLTLIPSMATGSMDINEVLKYAGKGYPSRTCTAWNGITFLKGSKNYNLTLSFMKDWAARYKNEPTILFWELGNELNFAAFHRNPPTLCASKEEIRSFIDVMSTAIKSADSNHLIASGAVQEEDPMPLGIETDPAPNATISAPTIGFTSLTAAFKYYNDLPNINFATFHCYGHSHIENTCNTGTKSLDIGSYLNYFSKLGKTLKKAIWVGEFGPDGPLGVSGGNGLWKDNPFSDFTQSLLLAKTYIGIDLISAWNWEVQMAIEPSNADALSSLTQQKALAGFPTNQKWQALVGDFNGDGKSDIALYSDRGLFQIVLTDSNTAGIPAQWLSRFATRGAGPLIAGSTPLVGDWDGDGKTDVGLRTKDGNWYVGISDGSKISSTYSAMTNFSNESGSDVGMIDAQAFTGDWNGDGKTDIGFKTKDGRWYVAFSDGNRFTNPGLWNANFGSEFGPDLGIQGLQVFTGDFNGDGKTDIGFYTRDGRWYIAYSDGTKFTNIGLALLGFGNQNIDPALAGAQVIIGDFDGNHKADFGLRSKDGRWYVALNAGPYRFNPMLWNNGFSNESGLDQGMRGSYAFAGDFNGDGKSDVGVRTGDGRLYIGFNISWPTLNVWEWLIR